MRPGYRKFAGRIAGDGHDEDAGFGCGVSVLAGMHGDDSASAVDAAQQHICRCRGADHDLTAFDGDLDVGCIPGCDSDG